MHPEKYTLSRHSHSDYLREMMREMMTSDDFTDVTLVTDDKKTIRAHRNILSACSPVFKNILQMEINNSHPVIYLRGIQYAEIVSILQFIYLGEAKFHEERINEFLLVSKNLEIRELSKDVEIDEADPSNQHQKYITDFVNFDHNNSIEEEKSSTIESEPTREVIPSVGSKFQCPQCDKLFSHKWNVYKHIKSAHEGVKYACNECDHQVTDQSSLRRHIQAKHGGVKYDCNKCDYQTTRQSHLKRHFKSKHS